jgi:hypothetical protein
MRSGRRQDRAGDGPVAPLAGHPQHAEHEDEQGGDVEAEQSRAFARVDPVLEHGAEHHHEQRERDRRPDERGERSGSCAA